jgi:hypothetical protein
MSEYPTIHRDLRELKAITEETAALLPAMQAALVERQQLIRWQAEATEVIMRWERCAEQVPPGRMMLGARRSDCVYAYIDHLHNELDATRAEVRELRRKAGVAGPTGSTGVVVFDDGAEEWADPDA